MEQKPIPAGELLEAVKGLSPESVIEALLDFPMEIHGTVVTITNASCACGGSYAWMHQRPSGAWEMKGCVCHNPALGV